MTIKELDDKLNSPGFQDTENGDLFYNFFIYQYPAEKEYDIRKQIQEFKQNLIRPTNYVDVLTLDLFEEFCNYLNGQKFLKFDSMLQYLLERIVAHITIDDEYRRPYVFMYGIGTMYPYLRANELLAKYEDYNETGRYKIILFYPGHREQSSFKLFDTLNDHHTYRATFLINE